MHDRAADPESLGGASRFFGAHMKSEMHRMLLNPIYTGDFLWLGQRRRGSHEPLVSRETFDRVQAVLHRKSGVRSPKQRHAFMGLIKCARCGCAMTAEKKKAKYIYYRCTGCKRACGNTYVREERLADLLGDTIAPIQITAEIATGIAEALRTGEVEVQQRRTEAIHQLEQRRRTVTGKLDRGYDDFVSGTSQTSSGGVSRRNGRLIFEPSRANWPVSSSRSSQSWRRRQDFRTRAKGRISLQIAGSDRTAPTAGNRAIELHVRSRKSHAYLQFAVRPARAREQKWKLAERVGFEPTCPLRDKTLSRRPRYDHFGTSPQRNQWRRITYFTRSAAISPSHARRRHASARLKPSPTTVVKPRTTTVVTAATTVVSRALRPWTADHQPPHHH